MSGCERARERERENMMGGKREVIECGLRVISGRVEEEVDDDCQPI